ncbi:tetratricopeptide repeat protein [Lutibacter sp. HS1-25]|uniref:tetratricopeptide repeat-containing sensor histidine kinase n=1 Tax=Lutibacter sp. HS1-25 TaxID=2485000 RepID=UPI001011A5AE|nr:tetratricopeptide repeat protein [Lutibacter sp. HS1-25]RXP45211.1 tetratricopeptide repeat protein [Lutibacter sp. HS1-25]
MQFFKPLLFILTLFLAKANSFSFTIENRSPIDSIQLKDINNLLANGNTKVALEKLYVFVAEAKKKKDTALVIESVILLANISRDNGDYQNSNKIFNEILPLIKNNVEKIRYVYFLKGGNFQLDNQLDSAKVNYEKALNFADEINGDKNLLAKLHANLSGIFYLEQDYNKAIEHSKIAANYQKLIGNNDIEAGILNNLGGIYYMQGKFNEALFAFEEAFSLVGFGQSDLQKKTRSTSYINLAYTYNELGDYKRAFEFQDKFVDLNDSLQQELKYKEITEIESKYQVATKEKEAAIEKSKRQSAEMLSYGLGLAILILLGGIFGMFQLFKLNKKNHKLLIFQEQLMHQNRLDKIKSESQAKILVATLDGRVEERKKIADILHGNVSAMLSAANLQLYAGGMQLNGSIPTEIEKAKSIISEASLQVRSLSHTLISAILLKHGLAEAVKDVCENSSNTTVVINCESKNMDRFESNFEIKIFNMINVLIDNLLKHSGATIGNVKLEQLNGMLQILVVDNGKGFDVDAENVTSGIGLSQVRARVEVLKGVFKITSTENGTRVYIAVPIVY